MKFWYIFNRSFFKSTEGTWNSIHHGNHKETNNFRFCVLQYRKSSPTLNRFKAEKSGCKLHYYMRLLTAKSVNWQTHFWKIILYSITIASLGWNRTKFCPLQLEVDAVSNIVVVLYSIWKLAFVFNILYFSCMAEFCSERIYTLPCMKFILFCFPSSRNVPPSLWKKALFLIYK